MTNGEKMQEMFPEGKTRKCRDGVVFESDGWCHAYDSDWWNAEYKGPTAKNDLGVDYISRQAVIDLMMQKWGENFSGDDAMQESIDAIRELPSVTPPQPRWIPVSERLPENKTYVLVTIGIPGRQPHARSGWYQDGFFHNDNGDCWRATDIEVKAWMPLPEPYKAESEADNG